MPESPRAVPASWYRGGTSKCWIFRAENLPEDPRARDALLIRAFGSPDASQIDGVGGATSVTSKALVVGRSSGDPYTVNYAFAQVSIDREIVEWDSNCGNCATGLAVWALDSAVIPTRGNRTEVRLRNTVTGLELITVVDTPGGKVPSPGSTVVPGTIYAGPTVALKFDRRSWSSYGPMLPTGHAQDLLVMGELQVNVSYVDAGAPAALMLATDLGMTATESAADFNAHMQEFVRLREAARTAMKLDGLGPEGESVPKIGIVGPASTSDDVDVHVRMVSMTAVHPTIGITSAVAVAAAAGIPGSTVDQVIVHRGSRVLTVGTLAGPVKLEIGRDRGGEVEWAMICRSARRIADAVLYVP